MSSVGASFGPTVRSMLRFDWSQVDYVIALRNTVGVVLPLAVGAATGQLLAGLSASLGALQVAFFDGGQPYRDRAVRMLAGGACSAASVFIGSTTGEIPALAILFAALWGFWGGLLVALGQAMTQIGLSSIVLLVIFAARPAPPQQAAIQAGLVFAGAIMQTLLSVAPWPVRPYGPHRVALAAALQQLAAMARTTPDPAGAPAATSETTNARLALAGVGDASSEAGEALRALLDETERIRLEIVALQDMSERVGDDTRAHVDAALSAAADVLEELAATLRSGRPPQRATATVQRLDDAISAMQRGGEADLAPVVARARVEALVGQLRAATELAAQGSAADAGGTAYEEALRPPHLRLREPLAILRANLTLRSAACRHAVRLAVGLTIAEAGTRLLAIPRSYWVPMTLAIILKPDFGATFSRGLGRLLGTALGLGVATGLVYVAFGDVAARIVLLGALLFAMRSAGRANYGLFVVALTALVVVFTSFAGTRPDTAIAERGLDTLLGGMLALAIYALWPTWERTQAPGAVADLLEAYRTYAAAVLGAYLEQGRLDPARLDEPRLAARLARTNAEASIGRMRDEPVGSDDLDRLDGILATSHRVARALMALEAGLYHDTAPPAPAELRAFASDVDAALRADIAVLRDPARPVALMPTLRADQRALAAALRGGTARDDAEQPKRNLPALLVVETDRLTDSINTVTAILRQGAAQPSSPAHMPASSTR